MPASDRIRLGDDGTLDTVLVCRQCGEEARYNFDGCTDPDCKGDCDPGETYAAFVEWAMEDFDSEHECTSGDSGYGG